MHFSVKNQTIAGDGELKDLSPGGCRIGSRTRVQLGSPLDVCIFPGDEGHPCTIEVATVSWVRHHEFELVFTGIQDRVVRVVRQLWRKRLLTT